MNYYPASWTQSLILGLCCLLSLAQLAAAQTVTARKAIQASYDKTCEAAGLKFIDGVWSVRTRDFKAFDPAGNSVNLDFERDRYQRLLAPALSVKKTAKILSFEQLDDSNVSCSVQEVYVVEYTAPGKPVKVVWESRSQDRWLKTKRGWRISESRVTHQVERVVTDE